MKVSAGEFLDLRARCAAGEGEVELLERLDRRQRGELEQRLALPFAREPRSRSPAVARGSRRSSASARRFLGERWPLGGDALRA